MGRLASLQTIRAFTAAAAAAAHVSLTQVLRTGNCVRTATALVFQGTVSRTATMPTETQAGPGLCSAGGPCLQKFHFPEGDLETNVKGLKRVITAVTFNYTSPNRGRLGK